MSNSDYIVGESTDYNNLYQANYIEAISTTIWSNKIQEIINDFGIPVGNVSSVKVTPVEATQQFDSMFPSDNQGGEVINVALPPLVNSATGKVIPGGGQSVTLQQYHDFIKVLNNVGNHLPKVTLTVNLGSMNFGELNTPPNNKFLDVTKGLQSFNVTINESGSSASITWGSGLLRMPKQDVIMTQVQPRAKYSMFVT